MTINLQSQEKVAKQLERITGLRFVPDHSLPDDEITGKPAWCIACDRTSDESPFLWRCWEDQEGSVWLESPQFEDVVESSYGGVFVKEVRGFNYTGYASEEVQERFYDQFGSYFGRIGIYRNYEQHVSAKQNVDLHLRFEGAVGFLLLSYGIRLAKKGEPISEGGLKKAVSVMAYLHRQINYGENEDKP